jgi:hypothetical protein
MRKLRAFLVTIVALLVLVTPSALSQRTSVGRIFPVYNNGDKPDLTIDPQRFTSQMEIVDRLFDDGTYRYPKRCGSPDPCPDSAEEGCDRQCTCVGRQMTFGFRHINLERIQVNCNPAAAAQE